MVGVGRVIGVEVRRERERERESERVSERKNAGRKREIINEYD